METEWNVLSDRWLPVIDLNANRMILSPLEVLQSAQELQQIALPSPLDLFAAHRFLITLLYWKADLAGGVEALAKELEEGTVPRRIRDELRQSADKFELYHKSSPFLQDPNHICKDNKGKPVGSLFTEYATGTMIAHFHHGHDEKMCLCFRCLTLGLMRVIPWTQSGGSGLTPSVHGAPPVMALPVGRTIGETLSKNLVTLSVKPGKAQWSGIFRKPQENIEIPYLTAFTWNPRIIKLMEPTQGVCWGCGETETVVKRLYFHKNPDTKKYSNDKPFLWKDPSAFYRVENSDDKLAPKIKYAPHKVDYRKYILKPESIYSSVVIENTNEGDSALIIVPNVNPANNKSYDHVLLEQKVIDNSIDLIDLYEYYRSYSVSPEVNYEFIVQDVPSLYQMIDNSKDLLKYTIDHFDENDWNVFRASSYSTMQEEPDAFTLMTAVYWSVRDLIRKKYTDANHSTKLPSHSSYWLTLKLMGFAPETFRRISDEGFNPLEDCASELGGKFPEALDRQKHRQRLRTDWPVALPRGRELEQLLRQVIGKHTHQRNAGPVNWSQFCAQLSRLNR